VKLSDSSGNPVQGTATALLTDTGLLSLSGYRVGNPLDYFGRTRVGTALLYETWRMLSPPLKAVYPLLEPGGGDGGGREGLFSAFRRQEELLSLIVPSVKTDEKGEAVFEVKVPEYSGKARLTIVAYSRDRFGISSQTTDVSRDLTVEPSLPLALAPRDAFTATVKLYLDPRAGVTAAATAGAGSAATTGAASPATTAAASDTATGAASVESTGSAPATAAGASAASAQGSSGPQSDPQNPGATEADAGDSPPVSGASLEFSTEGPLSIVSARNGSGPVDFRNYTPALKPGGSELIHLEMLASPPSDSSPGTPQAGEAALKVTARPKATGTATDAQGTQTPGSETQSQAASATPGYSFVKRTSTVVRPPYPRVSRATGGQAAGNTIQLPLDVSGFLAGTADAYLTLSSGPAAELARAVSYLAEYPYGCLEQTVSRAWVHLEALDNEGAPEDGETEVAEDTGNAAVTGVTGDTAVTTASSGESARALSGAIARLSTMRSFRGGFSYWPQHDSVYEWGSVYAAHFLTEASSRTILPPGLLEDSLAYLRRFLERDPGQDGGGGSGSSYIRSTKAYALFVLALNGEYRSGWINALRDKPQFLTPSARILLAGAEALRDGNPRALERLDREFPADRDAGVRGPGSGRGSLESDSRNLSLLLLAWTRVDPLNPRTKELAGLVSASGRSGHWGNTQENGMAVLALGAYSRESASGLPYQAELTAPDGTALAQGSELLPLTLGRKAAKAWLGGTLEARIKGRGRPWYSLVVTGSPVDPPEPVSKGGVTLGRVWSVRSPGKDAARVNPTDLGAYLASDAAGTAPGAVPTDRDGKNPLPVVKEGEDATSVPTPFIRQGPDGPRLVLRQGDTAEVTLLVTAEEALDNAVLSDLIPGGFETLPLRGNGIRPGRGRDGSGGPCDDGCTGTDTRLEIREDRVIAVVPTVKDAMSFRYGLRAVTPGVYELPPTAVEGMYDPSRQAVLPNGKVEVIPR
jgi:uncharacterized protein YfaS (alpha-2-macroglobulin family)